MNNKTIALRVDVFNGYIKFEYVQLESNQLQHVQHVESIEFKTLLYESQTSNAPSENNLIFVHCKRKRMICKLGLMVNADTSVTFV